MACVNRYFIFLNRIGHVTKERKKNDRKVSLGIKIDCVKLFFKIFNPFRFRCFTIYAHLKNKNKIISFLLYHYIDQKTRYFISSRSVENFRRFFCQNLLKIRQILQKCNLTGFFFYRCTLIQIKKGPNNFLTKLTILTNLTGLKIYKNNLNIFFIFFIQIV